MRVPCSDVLTRLCFWSTQSHRVRQTYRGTDAMKLDMAFAESMGSLIVEGVHKPFRALACALNQASVRVGKKKQAVDKES